MRVAAGRSNRLSSLQAEREVRSAQAWSRFVPLRLKCRGVVFASLLLLPGVLVPFKLSAQQEAGAPASAAHESGTVKSAGADGVTLTTGAGQDVTVKVPAAAKVLLVPPGSRDLKSATVGSLSDVAQGDRVLVTGVPGDTGSPMTAARLIVMKSSAIAQSHAADEAAWQHGSGGIVKSIDASNGSIVIVNGARLITVKTTATTVVRRYAGSSVRFEDAVPSSTTAIRVGDQVRVRGAKSADGMEITADGIVAGSFQSYSGLISAIDTDAKTVTLKDLASKHVVTVEVTPESNIRRLPPQAAQMIAGGERHAGAAGESRGGAESTGAPAGPPRQRPELAQILPRLPQQTLSDLKVGEAVMIVASSPAEEANHPSAITLLAGVEPILASPSSQSLTLSPWSVGGEDPAAAATGGGTPQP